jgi:hypothetical protein
VTAEVTAVHLDSGLVREDLEIGRLSAELADRFQDVSPEVIEYGVREEFVRWSSVPVRDFVPIFVARAVRGKLRGLSASNRIRAVAPRVRMPDYDVQGFQSEGNACGVPTRRKSSLT